MMPQWQGQTVVCLGAGPSLTAEDVDYVRGKARVIAINRTVELAPWADALYCADAKMWKRLDGAPTFAGLKYGAEARHGRFVVADHGVRVLRTGGSDGFSEEPGIVRTGGHSGYQAIHVAVHAGASRILLLGYDAQAGPGGRAEYHEPHPDARPVNYLRWRDRYEALVEPLRARGVAVINCSRETSIAVFPRQALREALPAASEVAA